MESTDTKIAAETPAATSAERKKAQPSDHLIPLTDGDWALWRWMGLRGAGFPASGVLKLASNECAHAADNLLTAQEGSNLARNRALDAVNAGLDSIKADGQWDDKERRDPLLKAMRLLKMEKLPRPINDGSAASRAIEEYLSARERFEDAKRAYKERFKAATLNASEAIQELLTTNRIREAIVWQNRSAYQTGIKVLLRKGQEITARSSKLRQNEEMVANYLQRYCVKNDTIGFFGPVGWAKFDSNRKEMKARPGPDLLSVRNVYFETWPISALAQSFAGDEAFRPWIAPRRAPFIYVDKAMLVLPGERPSKLSVAQAALLHSCNGERIAKEIASILLLAMPQVLKSEAEVYKLLEELEARGVITWKLEIPVTLYPERALYASLNRTGDEELRKKYVEALDDLNLARGLVAQASGDPEKLDQALDNLEATFTRLTGMAPTRSAGKTYAARTLVYEDCRRDLEVEVGADIIKALAPPLTLLLMSARWFSFQACEIYKGVMREIYNELVNKTGSRAVDAASFWVKLQPILFTRVNHPLDRLVSDFQRRWLKILSIAPEQRRMDYRCEELRPRVLAEFDAPNSGRSFLRYHSPDVMIAADDLAAIERGDYQLVLGELHMALNTLSGSLFFAQHPCPEEILKATALDHPEPRILPTAPKQWPRLTSRTQFALALPKDFHLTLSLDSVVDPKSRSLETGSLLIEERQGQLIAETRDGRLSFEVIDLFGAVLASTMVNLFKIFPTLPRTPRVTFDRMVVSRESWSFSPSEMEFAFEKDETNRFLAARSWAKAQGIPRFAFAKTPVEVKPFYIDFASPIYMDIFAKTIRRTMEANDPSSLISVTEMLPGTDQTWLPDSENNRYTSELRIIAVDIAK
jgi:lantibiotic biosynthesis dehydratase-like protein